MEKWKCWGCAVARVAVAPVLAQEAFLMVEVVEVVARNEIQIQLNLQEKRNLDFFFMIKKENEE